MIPNLARLTLVAALACVCDAVYFSDVSWSTGIKLSEYESYRSATILTYNVPNQALEARFIFEAKSEGSSCPSREVHIFLQHGSYPLLTFFNETFPAKFFVNRTNAFHLTTKTKTDAVGFNMSSPLPGVWYMSTFLTKQSSKIQPKEFDRSCRNGLFVTFETSGLDDIMDISTENTTHVYLSQRIGSDSAIYRFTLSDVTVEYSAAVTQCVGRKADIQNAQNLLYTSEVSTNHSSIFKEHSQDVVEFNNITNCPIKLRVSSSMMPFSNSDSVLSCGNQTSCQVSELSPVVKGWSYIFLQIDNSYNVTDVQLDLEIIKKECHSLKQTSPDTIYTTFKELLPAQDPPTLAQNACLRVNSLGRFTTDDEIFNVTYLMQELADVPKSAPLRNIPVPDYEVLVTQIEIQQYTDIGGTLQMLASLNKTSFNAATYQIIVYACLLKNAVPGGVIVRSCDAGLLLVLNSSSDNTNDVVYMPYPEAGSWYLGLNSLCINKNTTLPVRCEQLPKISMELQIKGCVNGQCGEYGVCQNYISGVHIFSSCKCIAGWRGYGCTDGTFARSRQHELLAVLLLTLSNLFFIPAIVLAVYRRFYVEAGTYFFTMFFSLFYHACDASELIQYCILQYSTLSFTDYFGSISAFWVTLLAMAAIPTKVRAVALTIGVMGMAVGVENEPQGIWKFAVPAGIATIILLASWIRQCVIHKHVYPNKKYFLYHLLPGALLALTGLVLFFAFETQENYLYTHSAWHMTISLSIVFLLPERHKNELKEDVLTELGDPTLMANHESY